MTHVLVEVEKNTNSVTDVVSHNIPINSCLCV